MNPQELLRPWLDAALGDGLRDVELFDVHTHTGANDPDGMKATLEELTGMIDGVGGRAVFFTMHEPDGYPVANDRVLEEAERTGGRFVPFGRVNPHDSAPAEARRALDAGARGIKLHPRAEQFTLDHPQVGELFEIAEERGVPILIHAGRGIPALGKHVVEHATRHPGANVILAHAGICDLAWIWRSALELRNLFFDTSWWNPADLITLFSLVPPGQILYGSDAPYGRPVLSVTLATRCALQAGLSTEQIRSVLGEQLVRILDGEGAADMGAPPGSAQFEANLLLERVYSSLVFSMGGAFAGIEQLAGEAMALARLACEVGDEAPEAEVCRSVLAALEIVDQLGGPSELGRGKPGMGALLMALCISATPGAPLPPPPAPADVGERQRA
ncbi:MAG TPA: amidohydrolase family protein [Thermoleophilaceae bacterium]